MDKRPVLYVVSTSGGKDSAATLALAFERAGTEAWRVVPIFCDTGNEHEAVYAYLDYLERRFDCRILRLTSGFAEEIAHKRNFIARDVRSGRTYSTRSVFEADGKTPVPKRDGRGRIVLTGKGKPMQKTVKIGGGRRVRWTNKAKRRALAVLYPSGNPYLDLCMWKGRFPSRKAQFCTEHLKRNLAVDFQLSVAALGFRVISWQGVRRDESLNRRHAKKFETIGAGIYAYRPLVEWSAADVFAYCARCGVEPNPLYLQGMGRVGCMPCINANKGELKQIANRFPGHIDRIAEWEKLVSQASKRQAATFIPAPGITPQQAAENDIYSVVRWAKTTRGGKVLAPVTDADNPTVCSSSYGLCE